MKLNIKNIPWKKVAKIGGYVVAAAVAASSAISEQKKAEEFEEMKKFVSELKGKES